MIWLKNLRKVRYRTFQLRGVQRDAARRLVAEDRGLLERNPRALRVFHPCAKVVEHVRRADFARRAAFQPFLELKSSIAEGPNRTNF